MNGTELMSQMKAGGFSDDEIDTWKTNTAQTMAGAGFSQDEIGGYFGVVANPNLSKPTAAIKANLDKHVAANVTPEGEKKPLDFNQALEAGFGSSVTGLVSSGKVPTEMSGAEPWYTRAAYSVAQLYGDAPAMIAGAVAGGAIGSEVPVLGTVVGAGAGAFAAPTYIREALIDGYKNGGMKSFGDLWDRLGPILLHTAKSAAVGATMSGAGGVAESVLAKTTAPAVVQKLGVTAAEIGTVATMGKALDGQMPTAQDFLDASILIGGMKSIGATPAAARAVKGKLESTFVKTGITPTQIVEDAKSNPSIVQDLVSEQDVPTAYGGKPERVEPTFDQGPPLPEPEKIVDAYHGTNRHFDVYGKDSEVEAARAATDGKMDGLFYFADKPEIANTYADGDGGTNAMGESTNGNVRPVKLDTSNWLEVDGGGARGTDRDAVVSGAIERAKAEGKDGVLVRNVVDPIGDGSGDADQSPHTVYIAFRRDQIRSRFEEPFATLPKEQQTPEAARAKILDQISVGGKDAPRPKATLGQLYAKTVDDLYPIKQAVDAITKGEDLPAAENPYALARLTRGSFGKAEQFVEHGTFDFNTLETNGKALKDILAPHADDLDGFRAYLASRRAIELSGREIESGFDIDAAHQVVGAGKKYELATKELDTYQDAVLAYGRDAGLFSDEAYSAMRDANRAYVPFNRVIEGVDRGGIGMGLTPRNPIKRIKGSEKLVVDPLESVIKNTFTMTAMADRNAVAKSFHDLASKAEDPSQFFEKVESPTRPVTVADAEMSKFLKDNGIEGMPEDALTVFRASRQPLAKDQVGFFDEGKWTVLRVDPDLAEAFGKTETAMHGMLMNLLAAPARGLRAGSALTPDFILRHGARIEVTSFVYSDNGYIPFYDRFRGLVSLLKKDDDFQNWMKSGGANSSFVTLDRNYLQSEIFKLIGAKPETNFLGHAWNAVSKPIEMLRATQEALEDASRIGEFKRAMSGKDATKANIQDAGYDTRNINIDSARIGSQMRGVNQLAAFFNSHLQHIDQIATKIRDNPIPTLAKIFAAVTLPSVALWVRNHDDPRYQELPGWQKDLFWIVMTDDHIFRIPKPFELGVLFGSGAEHLLDGIFPHDGHNTAKDVGDFAKALAAEAVPNPVPSLVTPIVEQVTNYSFFEGHPLIPASKEKLLPEFRYSDYTTELTKQLGHMIGTVPAFDDKSIASPLVIDNYVSQWTGTLGTYAVRAADLALRKSGALPDPVKATGTLADVPVVRAFVVRYPSATAQSIQDFREDFAKRAMVYATVQSLAKEGNAEAAVRVMQMNPSMMAKLDGMETALGKMTQAVHLIDQNQQMEPDAKRQLIDGIYYQMIEMSKAGNAGMRALEAASRGR